MDYSNERGLRKYFDEVVNKEAMDKIQKLEKDLKEMHKIELDAVKKELNKEKNIVLEAKKKIIYQKHQKEFNEVKRELSLELVKRRQELLDELVSEIDKKIKKYLLSKDYENKVMEVINKYKDNVLTIEINSKDPIIKKLDEKLVKKNDEIIGGVSLLLKNDSVVIDATLNSKMEEARQWFYNNAKLFIDEE
ncbi:MAG: hypothetical protein RBQ97_07355 [Acholeplasma sp.]|nr:hypothetical protein [Acholeplasma sp.]